MASGFFYLYDNTKLILHYLIIALYQYHCINISNTTCESADDHETHRSGLVSRENPS